MEQVIAFFTVLGIYAFVYQAVLLAQHQLHKWQKGGKK